MRATFITCRSPLIADDVYNIIKANQEEINSAIVYERDFEYNYFGFKTLQRSYLLKINGEIVERPQQMLMRVTVATESVHAQKRARGSMDSEIGASNPHHLSFYRA